MPVNLGLFEEVGEVLASRNQFFITTASPDGDSIGCMLALGLALKQQGKEPTLFSPEPIPGSLLFLPEVSKIVYEIPARSFDALLVVDTGSSKILFHGNRDLWRKISDLVINIDHHPDNDQFGKLNLVTPEAASTGEIVYQLLTCLKWEINEPIATCLLTSMMADTGAFRYPNVTPATLRMAAELLGKGAKNGVIARQLYSTQSIPYVKLLGQLFNNLQVDLGGKLAWSVLSRKDFEMAGAPEDTADKMVEQLDMLRDVQAFALLRQMGDGKIKVSLRSRDRLPVNKIAALFGGGGHLQAAGCQLSGDLKEAEKKIVTELRALL